MLFASFASRNNSQNPGPDPKRSVIVENVGKLIHGKYIRNLMEVLQKFNKFIENLIKFYRSR